MVKYNIAENKDIEVYLPNELSSPKWLTCDYGPISVNCDFLLVKMFTFSIFKFCLRAQKNIIDVSK